MTMEAKPARRPAASGRRRRDQHGAALLTAMVIVTLIATLTVGMIWQQWRAVQVEAAERIQTQARWILDGALDWGRLILREDQRENQRKGGTNTDHLGEPWAVELKEARLSTFLAADKDNTDDAPDAFLSGRIRDAQARFNLNNLVRDNKFQPKEAAVLAKLCELAGSSTQVASVITTALQAANPGSVGEVGASAPPVPSPINGAAPLFPTRVADLSWLGIDEATVARLEPFIVILPRATPVNLNTAPKEVIAAVVNVDLSSAQRVVQQRASSPIKSVEEARTLLNLKELDAAVASVNSSYFEIDGALRIDRLVVAQRSLVERNAQGVVKILRTDRVMPGSKPAIQLQQ